MFIAVIYKVKKNLGHELNDKNMAKLWKNHSIKLESAVLKV